MVTPPQQFCVRWNSYQTNLQNAFPKLLTSEHFVDVTLACENEMLKCHKVVLSACSTYFEKLLLDNPCQHPIIFMKDMRFQEMQSLVDFMYKGEVNVTQDDLPSLLKSAEALQIRGLCGSDQLLNQQQFGGTLKNSLNSSTSSLAPLTSSSGVLPSSTTTTTNQHNNNTKNTILPSSTTSSSSSSVITTATTTTTTTTTTTLNNQENHKDSKYSNLNNIKREHSEKLDSDFINNPSSSECDSNDGIQTVKDGDGEFKLEIDEDTYYDNEDLMDTEFCEEDSAINTNDLTKTPEFAIANVSCQYDGSGGSASNRRIRRSDEELRRAAECITRGQTFQTVSDQFNIPISTIRFYMARKGILPRRKRGRACSGPTGNMQVVSSSVSNNAQHTFNNSSGNTSPIGPPYHIVHYKLPQLGVSKLK